jgi:hypothetical protein
MRYVRGAAAALVAAALAGGGVAAAAQSSHHHRSMASETVTTTTTTTTGTTASAPSTTTTTPPKGRHRGFGFGRRGGFGLGFAFGFQFGFGGLGGLAQLDAATGTALQETAKNATTAARTALDGGKSFDEARDAAIAAAGARLDTAVSADALTKGQAAAVLAAVTKDADGVAAVADAAATALKLSPADLYAKLKAGTSLPAIAKAQGVTLSDVFSAIQKARQANAPSGANGKPVPGGGWGSGGGPGFFGGNPGFFGGHRGGRGFGPPPGFGKGGPGPQPPTTTSPSYHPSSKGSTRTA